MNLKKEKEAIQAQIKSINTQLSEARTAISQLEQEGLMLMGELRHIEKQLAAKEKEDAKEEL